MRSGMRLFGLLAAAFLMGGLTVSGASYVLAQGTRTDGRVGNQQAGPVIGAGAPNMDNKLMKQPLWFYITRNVKDAPPAVNALHLKHQAEMEQKGIFFGAGPVFAPDGKHEYGLIIFRAKDAADAKRIADSDPMHQMGYRKYELHQWDMNEGHMDISLDFHDSHVVFK